jgi:hypothetical protein
MPDKREHTLNRLPATDYSYAIAWAREWLGDRYLLAKPINAARPRSADGRNQGPGGTIQHAPIF